MASTTTAFAHNIFHDGLGGGNYTELRNTANTIIGSFLIHRGLGTGFQADLTNVGNGSTVAFLRTAGTGRGLEVDITNAASTNLGMGVFHAGDGFGQYVAMTNAAATTNSVGLFVQYNGTGGGTGGGGNAVEIQNYGTNGNAVDVFVGNPGVAQAQPIRPANMQGFRSATWQQERRLPPTLPKPQLTRLITVKIQPSLLKT